jgi:hypothetical protein
MSDHRYGSGAPCIEVPGGWIYFGGPLNSPVLVSDPAQWARTDDSIAGRLDRILESLSNLHLELHRMSQTLSQQLDAATTAIETDVAAVATEVSQLLASMTPGSQVTQAQVDRLTAIDTAMKAIPPATPVVIPPTP